MFTVDIPHGFFHEPLIIIKTTHLQGLEFLHDDGLPLCDLILVVVIGLGKLLALRLCGLHTLLVHPHVLFQHGHALLEVGCAKLVLLVQE